MKSIFNIVLQEDDRLTLLIVTSLFLAAQQISN
jgi:hypothetical protein